MSKIEATVAKFAATAKGETAEQQMLLKVLRNLPAAHRQAFIKQFAAKEMARLITEAAA